LASSSGGCYYCFTCTDGRFAVLKTQIFLKPVFVSGFMDRPSQRGHQVALFLPFRPRASGVGPRFFGPLLFQCLALVRRPPSRFFNLAADSRSAHVIVFSEICPHRPFCRFPTQEKSFCFISLPFIHPDPYFPFLVTMG